MSNTQVLCFKAILSFVSDLNKAFGELNRPIKLYFKILEQITFTHQTAIEKNIQLFTLFTHMNQEAILNQDFNLLSSPKLEYSDKAYIDFEYVFNAASSNEVTCIWQHLLTLSAIIHPQSRARSVLMSLQKSDSAEANLINNMVSKIEEHVDLENTTNPMEAVTKIMQSGAFADMVKDLSESMQSGNINIEKLMASIGGPMMGN